MAAGLFKAPTINFKSTSLDGAINDSANTISVNSATNLQSPGYIVINREDGSGAATPNSREVVKYTGISSNDLTGCARGADGSTARAHSDGALVETMFTIGMHNDQRDAINAEHDTDGTHTLIASATVTTLDVENLNLGSEPAGIEGQFVWTRSGSLATVLAATATDNHFPLLRATKDLTINSFYASLVSAPSLAAFQCDINYLSGPTAAAASIFSTVPTIDKGEYSTDTAAAAAAISLTSLASGNLLQLEIDSHGNSAGIAVSLKATGR